MTKAALNHMTRLLAKSCAPVRVNAVAPGSSRRRGRPTGTRFTRCMPSGRHSSARRRRRTAPRQCSLLCALAMSAVHGVATSPGATAFHTHRRTRLREEPRSVVERGLRHRVRDRAPARPMTADRRHVHDAGIVTPHRSHGITAFVSHHVPYTLTWNVLSKISSVDASRSVCGNHGGPAPRCSRGCRAGRTVQSCDRSTAGPEPCRRCRPGRTSTALGATQRPLCRPRPSSKNSRRRMRRRGERTSGGFADTARRAGDDGDAAGQLLGAHSLLRAVGVVAGVVAHEPHGWKIGVGRAAPIDHDLLGIGAIDGELDLEAVGAGRVERAAVSVVEGVVLPVSRRPDVWRWLVGCPRRSSAQCE